MVLKPSGLLQTALDGSKPVGLPRGSIGNLQLRLIVKEWWFGWRWLAYAGEKVVFGLENFRGLGISNLLKDWKTSQ